MNTISFRLKPGEDLRLSIERMVVEQNIQAGCILTCVGSLTVAELRLANAVEYRRFPGPFEIVSLVGTLGPRGVHLHIGLADAQGLMIGGHLVAGCKVYTTAEIVIGSLPGVRFNRAPDKATGYDELVVEPMG